MEETALKYRKPYTTPHTFAEWMLLINKPPNEVAMLMGQASTKMIHEVYGKYRLELGAEQEAIRDYMGREKLPDYVQEFGQSLGKVKKGLQVTTCNPLDLIGGSDET